MPAREPLITGNVSPSSAPGTEPHIAPDWQTVTLLGSGMCDGADAWAHAMCRYLNEVRYAIRSASSWWLSCWSNPCGMSETVAGLRSAMDCRLMRSTCLGPVVR